MLTRGTFLFKQFSPFPLNYFNFSHVSLLRELLQGFNKASKISICTQDIPLGAVEGSGFFTNNPIVFLPLSWLFTQAATKTFIARKFHVAVHWISLFRTIFRANNPHSDFIIRSKHVFRNLFNKLDLLSKKNLVHPRFKRDLLF